MWSFQNDFQNYHFLLHLYCSKGCTIRERRSESYLGSLLGGSGRGSLTWREFGRECWSASSTPDSAVSPLLCFCRASAIILATRSLSTLKWKVFNKIYWKNGYFNQKLFPIALELFHLNVPGIKTEIWIKRLNPDISQIPVDAFCHLI